MQRLFNSRITDSEIAHRTNRGRAITFRLVPHPGRGYTVQPMGSVSVDDRIVSLFALDADTGAPADASQSVFAQLGNGIAVNGVVLVISNGGARIYKPAAAKGAHKTWDTTCHAANVVRFGAQGCVLVGLFGKESPLIQILP